MKEAGPGQRLTWVLLGIFVLGAGVFLWSTFVNRRAASSHHPRGLPEWVARAPHKRDFLSLLRPTPDHRAEEALKRLAAARAEMTSTTSSASRWNLSRTLPRGYEFDSQLFLTARRTGPAGSQPTELVLRIERPKIAPLTYRAETGPEGLTKLAWSGANGEFQSVNLTADQPLSIGDLRVRDAVDLYAALAARRLRPAGALEGLGSLPLRVFEVVLQNSAATRRGTQEDELSGAGRTALLYCDAKDLTPRAVRVFDSGERLVRTYDDLVFETADPAVQTLRLKAFRVDSLPTASHSFFRLESLSLSR